MSDIFATIFNVGGNGRQLLVYRERDEERDITVMHHVTVIDGVRADFKLEFPGEDQDERAQDYLDNFELETAESMYLKFFEMIKGGNNG